MKIRKATKKDIIKIAKLIKTEFNKPPYNDGWTDKRAKITTTNYLRIGYGFVAIINNKIAGAIIIRDDPYSKGLYIIVEELIVDSKFQKQGIGKALIKIIEKEAKRKKAHTVYLYTSRKSRAFKFYKKLGYKESKSIAAMGKVLK